MYVCSCRAVTDTQINQAIAGGASSLSELAEACGAGATCRGCWPALLELLDDHGLMDREAPQGRPHRAA